MKHKSARVYSLIMNCTAPVLTALFLGGAVCWAAELQYEDTAVYSRTPEAIPALSEKGLRDNESVPFECAVPVSDIVLTDNVNTGAELVEACGVYIGDRFIGAVTDGESVEKELDRILDEYRSDDRVIEADFAVEPDIKEGLYRTETLVKEDDMADFLAGEKEVVGEYTAETEDTPEKIAEDFGMSIDEVKELNPEIDEESIKNGDQVKVKETVAVLPVKYVCEEQEEEIVEVDSLCYDEEHRLVPGGIVSKKLSTYEVTYVDGNEVSRKLKNTETLEMQESVDGEAALYSESVPDTGGIFAGDFICPVNGCVSDPFMSDRNHKGMDIAAPEGTDICAADGGTVLEAGWNDGGYGYYVMIDHGNGYVTLYAHASEVYVSAGEEVEQGELIAAVGTTGDSTGNHCHFEVRYNGEFLDPANFV